MPDADYTEEIWKTIPGWERLYEASSWGRVKSLARPDLRGFGRRVSERIMKQSINASGRLYVNLSNRKAKMQLVHRLILLSFVGPCPAGMQCCHWDGNPRNNRLENLRWDTCKANNADKKRHGTNNRGERHSLAKLTESSVLEILELRGKLHRGRIAHRFGISLSSVNQIMSGKSWRHIPRPITGTT